MTLVDQSVALVRRAASRIGKKPLADRAGLSDAILHTVHSEKFSPTVRTLRSLETAAAAVEAEAASKDGPLNDPSTSANHDGKPT